MLVMVAVVLLLPCYCRATALLLPCCCREGRPDRATRLHRPQAPPSPDTTAVLALLSGAERTRVHRLTRAERERYRLPLDDLPLMSSPQAPLDDSPMMDVERSSLMTVHFHIRYCRSVKHHTSLPRGSWALYWEVDRSDQTQSRV